MTDHIIAPGVELLESMRSVGYTFTAALADIIDNSITANAQRIEIDVDVVNGDYVAILDDGTGMSREIALEALRLAGSTGTRPQGDLGRFGLGLKTASLSQGRKLSVITKTDSALTGLRWDIDYVKETNQWALQDLSIHEIEKMPLIKELQSRTRGTLVIWENLDLLLGDATDVSTHLQSIVSSSKQELSLIFHQYLESRSRKLSLVVNGLPVPGINPFLESHQKTQISPPETVSVGGEKVVVTAFTLPHSSHLNTQEKKRADLSERMRDFQGFYVYRNKRLISYGDWFGILPKSEITKQTRIKVEIPTTIDDLWQLDIKKSRTVPPASFRNRLKRIVDQLVHRGKEVHTFRGRRQTLTHFETFWKLIEEREGYRYELNKDHPVLKSISSSLDPNLRKQLDTYLDLIATTFPADDLYARMAGNSIPNMTIPDEIKIREVLMEMHSLGGLPGTLDESVALLSKVEPFSSLENLTLILEPIFKE